MMNFVINKKKFLISFAIGVIALVGDNNVQSEKNPLVAAICDNVTHGLIGVFTWIGIFITKTANIDLSFVLEFIICGICSSIIDADHFVAAKSLNLKDATNLKSRPLMHCTTFTTLIVVLVLTLSYCLKMSWLCKFGWILAAAFVSHHIRDSKRRGFWLWPFGSTPPTPTVLYIIAQVLLPHIFSLIINEFTPQSFKDGPRMNIQTV